jgi:hypothetical protein
MARYLGEVVHYFPHPDHPVMTQPEHAAIVGRVYADGGADLLVLVPNREPTWLTKVPQGDSHHCHRSILLPASAA